MLNNLIGSVKYTVKAKKPLKLLNQLKSEVAVRNVKTLPDGILAFTCFYRGEKRARQIIFEHGGEITGCKRYGLVYLLRRYKKRTGLFVSAVILAVVTFMSQLFVWNISVEGNEKIPDGEIIRTLNEIGFREGVYKKGVKLDSLVNNFLIREKRISWLAVNFDGTTAHVEVREGKNPVIAEKKKNVNLVASHDGIIMRADVLEGESFVQKGDVVYKGQLLVSAFVKGKDTSYLRGARGSVWANTERKICVIVPFEYNEKVPNGKIKKKYTLSVLGKRLPLYFTDKIKDLCSKESEVVTDEKKKGLRLPFVLTKETYTFYETVQRTRKYETALETARKRAEETLFRLSPGFVCASKHSEHKANGAFLVYTCTFSGVENIAKALEFELS